MKKPAKSISDEYKIRDYSQEEIKARLINVVSRKRNKIKEAEIEISFSVKHLTKHFISKNQ